MILWAYGKKVHDLDLFAYSQTLSVIVLPHPSESNFSNNWKKNN